MEGFPRIDTDRLILDKFRIKDIPNITLLANDIAISDNLLNIPSPYHEEDATAFLTRQIDGYERNTAYIFAIFLRTDEVFTGVISLHLDKISNKAELGYWVGAPFRNKGIATEAVKALLRFGFEVLHLNKIFATHFKHNVTSGKVMHRAGMIIEAHIKEHYFKNGMYQDVVQSRLTRNEYRPDVMLG